MTERYYKQSEASHLKCAAMLCGAAETTEQEQQCAPLPATTVHVAKVVRVTETKPVRSVQTSPPPVASLSTSVHTEDVKVGSCSTFRLMCDPYGDPFQPFASPVLAASDVYVMLTPAAPTHAHPFKLFSSSDIAKMTQRRQAKRRRFVINGTSPVQKKPQIMEVDARNTHGDSSDSKSYQEIRSTNAEKDALCTQQTQNLVVKLGHQLGKLRAVKKENSLQRQDEGLLSDDDVICLTQVEAAKVARSRPNKKGLNGDSLCVSCNIQFHLVDL